MSANKSQNLSQAVLIAVIILLVFMVFSNTLSYGFLSTWDDPEYITENPYIRGLTLTNIKASFTHFFMGNYAPVQIISYMLDYELWGMDPKGFHLTNVLLHAFNSALCFLIIRVITKNIFVSLSAALFFALHPVQTETVSWLSQRKTLLSMFFMLSSFLFYIRYSENKKISILFISLVLFLLSLLSKAVTVFYPLMLIAYEMVSQDKKRLRESALDISLFAIFSLGISVITIKAQGFQYGGGLSEYHGGNFLNNIFTMFSVTLEYLRLVFMPLKLSAVYEPPVYSSFWELRVMAGASVVAFILCLTFYLLYNKKQSALWSIWIIVFLLPVFQIVPIYTLMNDRYLYLPLAGVTVLLSIAAGKIPKKAIAYSVVLVFSVLLSFMTYSRNIFWKDSYTLWTDAVQKTPASGVAWNNLAGSYAQKSMNKEALEMFQRAVMLRPNEPKIHFNLGRTYIDTGDIDNAIASFRTAIKLYNNYYDAWLALEDAFYKKGEIISSEETRKALIGLKPPHSSVYTELGRLDIERKRFLNARDNLSKAISMNNKDADAYLYLSMLYAEKGDKQKALQNLKEALKNKSVINKSFRDNEHFKSLKNDPEFNNIVSKAGVE